MSDSDKSVTDHVFQIQLQDVECLYIRGDCDALGNFKEFDQKPMELMENNMWIGNFNIPNNRPVKYKYVGKRTVKTYWSYNSETFVLPSERFGDHHVINLSYQLLPKKKDTTALSFTKLNKINGPVFLYKHGNFNNVPLDTLVDFQDLDNDLTATYYQKVICYAFNHTNSRVDTAIGKKDLTQLDEKYGDKYTIIILHFVISSNPKEDRQEISKFEVNNKKLDVVKFWYDYDFTFNFPENNDSLKTLQDLVNKYNY